jgi:hypothetical protein
LKWAFNVPSPKTIWFSAANVTVVPDSRTAMTARNASIVDALILNFLQSGMAQGASKLNASFSHPVHTPVKTFLSPRVPALVPLFLFCGKIPKWQ